MVIIDLHQHLGVFRNRDLPVRPQTRGKIDGSTCWLGISLQPFGNSDGVPRKEATANQIDFQVLGTATKRRDGRRAERNPSNLHNHKPPKTTATTNKATSGPKSSIEIMSLYTGQMKVALVDVETHDNPIPLESYTMRQGKVWAVICHPGKPFIIDLKRCDN